MAFKNKKLHHQRWMSYDAAKMTIQSYRDQYDLTSRRKYVRWHRRFNPIAIPRFPNRVYSEFTTWNDYLGVDNAFVKNSKRYYRPYWEAVSTVQALAEKYNWNTSTDYRHDYDSVVPNDIPKVPEQYYDDWKGWRIWLGLDIRKRIMAANNVQGILAICNLTSHPGNVIKVVIAKHGVSQLRQIFSEHNDLLFVKGYHYSSDDQQICDQIFKTFCSEMDEPGMYIVPNVSALMFELDNNLMVHNG